MLAVKRLAGVTLELNLRECFIIYVSTKCEYGFPNQKDVFPMAMFKLKPPEMATTCKKRSYHDSIFPMKHKPNATKLGSILNLKMFAILDELILTLPGLNLT